MYMHLSGMGETFIPNLPCLCANVRRATRALTQVYEEALRPVSLRATQLTILQVLSRAGEVSQGQLGEMLAMDSTSLTRTLAIMSRRGWIAERRGKDRRERLLSLSGEGKNKLKRGEQVWERLQSRLQRQLGNETWNGLMRVTDEVARKITTH